MKLAFPTPLMTVRPEARESTPRAATYAISNGNSWIIEPQAVYSKNVNASNFQILIGTTISQNNSEGYTFLASGFSSDDVMKDMHAAGNTSVISALMSTYKYNAAFGQFNYNLKDRYIINLTGRRDGTSRFGSENRFNNFGSVGAALGVH